MRKLGFWKLDFQKPTFLTTVIQNLTKFCAKKHFHKRMQTVFTFEQVSVDSKQCKTKRALGAVFGTHNLKAGCSKMQSRNTGFKIFLRKAVKPEAFLAPGLS